ncbi:MAG TPA: GNAT family N-acetyltransferase [Pirellulales bacterium]|nr:GNAT family N-acetyltransferase [Pirellulales bacterium]
MSEFSPVALLESNHDRTQFDCGVEPLNAYLKQYALQNQKKGIVRNYVICRGTRVVGYYSLAYGSVAQTNVPAQLSKGIGKYPIPLMILARLAVDVREKGQGLGKALLKDAILRTLQAAEIAGLKAILVHAKDEAARQFYTKHGFLQSPGDPFHLFFPLDPLRK